MLKYFFPQGRSNIYLYYMSDLKPLNVCSVFLTNFDKDKTKQNKKPCQVYHLRYPISVC